MRSIRRSLIISFALLFVAGLLAVAVSLDRIASENLEARARVSAESIENEFQERCREERDKLDQHLLNEARTIVSQMQTMYAVRYDQEWRRFLTTTTVAERFATADPWTRLVWEASTLRWESTRRGESLHRWASFAAGRTYFANLHL